MRRRSLTGTRPDYYLVCCACLIRIGYEYVKLGLKPAERPALIILDLGLPVGDGFVVLDRLQTSDTLSGVPVIVLSARDPQTNEERALKAGAAAFFQKPADNEELMNVIRASLGTEAPAVPAHTAAWPS